MKTNWRRFLKGAALLFILMNMIAFFHAYKFTHFSENDRAKTQSPEKLSTIDKLKTLILGVNNPRPENAVVPKQAYKTIYLESNKKIEAWLIMLNDSVGEDSTLGTVIIFHGYGGNKSAMLDKSNEFLSMGYNTLLVDFMGSGGSDGNSTTIGYQEAVEVKTTYDYLVEQGEAHIFLFGTSMGSVAMMKAINDYQLKPDGIIIECPFGSMYQTVGSRFWKMGLPAFPMADLLVFWGGIQNGFWGFGYKPSEYARAISCPTLLLYGEQDNSVSRQEIDEIFSNLAGEKILKTYANSGHENYLIKYHDQWVSDVEMFFDSINE